MGGGGGGGDQNKGKGALTKVRIELSTYAHEAPPSKLKPSQYQKMKSVVQKSRRESAHVHTFGGDFELNILRMREFTSRFLDNGPEI